jgi:hypothetical protein
MYASRKSYLPFVFGNAFKDQLGIPCYDQELIQKIAQESGYCEEFIAEKSEQSNSKFLSNPFAFRDYYGNSIQDKLWLAQLKAIVEVANKGPCVIIGRCADFILDGTADLLKVFIHADNKSRAKRIVEQYGETEQSPEKRLKEKDKRRAAYYQVNTDKKWGDMKNYDIALSTSSLSIERCAEIIAQLYKTK